MTLSDKKINNLSVLYLFIRQCRMTPGILTQVWRVLQIIIKYHLWLLIWIHDPWQLIQIISFMDHFCHHWNLPHIIRQQTKWGKDFQFKVTSAALPEYDCLPADSDDFVPNSATLIIQKTKWRNDFQFNVISASLISIWLVSLALGNTSLKKECFLSGIAQITSPRPPPFRATCTSFAAVKNKYIYCIF